MLKKNGNYSILMLKFAILCFILIIIIINKSFLYYLNKHFKLQEIWFSKTVLIIFKNAEINNNADEKYTNQLFYVS